SSARASTLYVRQNGNDQSDGQTAANAFATLTHLAQVLSHGDSAVIGPGTYHDAALVAEVFGTPDTRVTIAGDESGKLTGDAPGPVVVTPPPDSSGAACLRFHRAQHLTVTGLTFRAAPGGGGQGVVVEKSRDVIVERCTFDGLSRGFVAEN